MRRLILFFASGFFSGYAPFASGTAGTLVGIPIYLLFSRLPLPHYGILTIILFAFGVWLAFRAEIILGEKDSGVIVIDEIAGFLVTLFALPRTGFFLVGGFLLFRALDILKPWPVRAIDQRCPGGWGVMLDDVVAGLYANLSLHLLAWVLFR